MNDLPIFIDVEASGFGVGGYPIEVGFVEEDATPHCFLIRPLEEWTFWDDSAQGLHGISRETLKKHGHQASEVASSLNACLSGKIVYSDAWSFDMSWLGKLFDATDLPQMFRIASLLDLLSETQREQWQNARQEVISELKLKRHRASSDARILRETYKRMTNIS